ncbi:MAG: hypothetical protein HQM09_17155 [Candidatus Riflebacteria bacterium]|nr:hypothetical protein [Candidatus Riflebacteria bacterium]
MPGNISCDHAKWLMSEVFSTGISGDNDSLMRHLDACAACKREYEEISSSLTTIRSIRKIDPVPSPLFEEALEKRIVDVQQESPVLLQIDLSTKQLLIAQYTYVTLLGIGLWISLAYGQPLFLQLTSWSGFSSPEWFSSEYGLFIFFFTFGGFSAILAVPILVHACRGEISQNAWLFKIFRFVHGNLRMMAC